MTDISDLIARVEAGKGGDRELDAEVWALFGGGVSLMPVLAGNNVLPICPDCPHFTTSLDALLPLIGDQSWRVEDHPLAGPCAIVDDIDAYADTPVRALLAAILRAKEVGE